MGRGVSYGGGQSSLDYLFGSGEAPKSTTANAQAAKSEGRTINKEPASKPAASAPVDATKQTPAGIQSTASNHFRGDTQNTGNFITPKEGVGKIKIAYLLIFSPARTDLLPKFMPLLEVDLLWDISSVVAATKQFSSLQLDNCFSLSFDYVSIVIVSIPGCCEVLCCYLVCEGVCVPRIISSDNKLPSIVPVDTHELKVVTYDFC